MALLLARRQQRFSSNPSLIRFFSNSSSDSPPEDGKPSVEKPSSPPSDSSYTSPFADIKSRLQLKVQKQQEQGSKPFARSNAQSQNHGSSRFPDNQSRFSPQDLGKNLANFSRRSTITPSIDSGGVPPSQSRPQISLEALYKQNAAPNSSDPGNRKTQDFNSSSVWENLKNLRSQTNTSNNMEKKGVSLRSFKSTLQSLTKENIGSNVFQGAEALPNSVFGKEMNRKKGKEGETEEMRTDFLKFYNPEELGDKLKMLRPEGNKEGELFSLQELNQRLGKLRQVEEKEVQTQSGTGKFSFLRDAVATLKDDAGKNDANSQQNLAMFGYYGVTHEYKHHPPKDELVETYFHPDNMSSADKMKIELTKVRDEFKMSESDCGSARVQVAQLTTKIKHLAEVLHKKDKHSLKGLKAMVQKRKKLLKYLRRTDWDSYCLVLSKFGLRDNLHVRDNNHRDSKNSKV